MSAKRAVVVNALAFQACWLAFVAGAARGEAWIGFVALAVFAAYTLATTHALRADLALVAVAATGGFAVDSLFAVTGLVDYRSPSPNVAPAWIVGLWVAFALTLGHSLAFLQDRLSAAALLGALGGPLSYWAAARAWDAVTLAEPAWMPLAALALAWAGAMPALAALARRLAPVRRAAGAP